MGAGVRALLASLLIVFSTATVALLARPQPALASRSIQVTRCLDYLHAHQGSDGHFQDPGYTAWAIIAIAAAGENPHGGAWTRSGRSPIDYLQSVDIDAYATSGSASNPPCYFAKMILAYTAAARRGSLSSAGVRGVSLVDRLLAYQRSDGRFCPTASSDYIGAVNATTWAILALQAAGSSPAAQGRAVSWLKGQQLSDGGFANMAKDGPGTPTSDVDDTAAAIQALVAGGVSRDSNLLGDARAYLQAAQRADGGFSSAKSGGYTYSESTAWAIQAILALGEDPDGAAWSRGGKSPRDALRELQAPTGALYHRSGVIATPLLSTTQGLVGLAGRTFSTFPTGSSSWVSAFSWSPRVTSFSPASGVTISSTAVAVRAAYSDGSGGTGISASGIRFVVDGRDLTSQAHITPSSLTIQLTGLASGRHTLALTVRDRAGNGRSLAHTLTVRSGSGAGGIGPAAESSSAGVTSGAGSTAAGETASSVGAKTTASASTRGGVPLSSVPGAAASPESGSSLSSGTPGNATGAPAAPPSGEAASDTSIPLPLLAVMVAVPTTVGFWLARRAYRRWSRTPNEPPAQEDKYTVSPR